MSKEEEFTAETQSTLRERRKKRTTSSSSQTSDPKPRHPFSLSSSAASLRPRRFNFLRKRLTAKDAEVAEKKSGKKRISIPILSAFICLICGHLRFVFFRPGSSRNFKTDFADGRGWRREAGQNPPDRFIPRARRPLSSAASRFPPGSQGPATQERVCQG